MKFHFLVAVLVSLIALLFYFLLSGFRTDLKTARPAIEKESVARLRQIKNDKTVETHGIKIDEVFNKNALNNSDKEISHKSSPVVIQTPVKKSIERLQGQDYWCSQIPVRKDFDPVRCEYTDACYSCAESDIIPPEIESAIPFCKDGTRPDRYSVECCPSGISSHDIVCPSFAECMQADNVPTSACTCNSRPNCHYVKTNEGVDCLCDP